MSFSGGVTVGEVIDVVTFGVEAGKIHELARASFASDEVHFDAAAAAGRGYTGQMATATHVVVSLHYRDQTAWVARLGLDIERVVMGSVRWTFVRPLIVGDRVVGTRRLVGDEVKRGKNGLMRVLQLETDFVDSTGVAVVTQHDAVIERPVS